MVDYASNCKKLIKRGTGSAEKAQVYLRDGEARKAAEELIDGSQDLLTVKNVTDAVLPAEKILLLGELDNMERAQAEAGKAVQSYIARVRESNQTLEELGLKDLENLFGNSTKKTSS